MTIEGGRGQFITVEGTEGVGKSSNISYLRQLLEARGKKVVVTREPGGTPLGERIRGLLLGREHEQMTGGAELLLVFAARAQHLDKVIEPTLKGGTWLICDRFTDATYAYQGGGRGVSMSRIQDLENWVQGPVRPDLTFVLDLPVEIGMKRAARRGEPDRFERERLEFFERVRNTYLARAAQESERVRIIDASGSLEDVRQRIRHELNAYLDRKEALAAVSVGGNGGRQ